MVPKKEKRTPSPLQTAPKAKPSTINHLIAVPKLD